MKKQMVYAMFGAAALFFVSANAALAHETRMYTIGDKPFQMTIGSLNEPIAVDDKTGVSITVSDATNAADGDEHAVAGVTGLEQTLKVELIAGDKKKTMDLTPVHGEVGHYRANFIPTVQTTYTYRFFGTVNNTPIDVSFSCNPAGHPASAEDTNVVAVSEGVTQTLRRGAFGCPVTKTDLGFPEPSMSEYELVQQTNAALGAVGGQADYSRGIAFMGVGIAILALVLAIFGIVKGRGNASGMQMPR